METLLSLVCRVACSQIQEIKMIEILCAFQYGLMQDHTIPFEQHSPVPPVAICMEQLIKHVVPFALSCNVWQNVLS